jgi:hypothetical protein
MAMKQMISVLICLLVSNTPVLAGYKQAQPVSIYIDPSYRFANGDLGYVRNTSDSTQFIGCSSYAWKGSPTYAYCYAVDLSGTYVACIAADPATVRVVSALSSDTYLYFSWDANGYCTFIWSDNQSAVAPKLP